MSGFWSVVWLWFSLRFSFFPQVHKSMRTRKARDLSQGMCVIIWLGALTWLAYGIHINEWAIIAANSLTLVSAATVIASKLRWG